MPRFDETSAECLVLTYKEGLLSAMGHDLVLRVDRFLIIIDDQTLAIQAGFDAASLKVVSAVSDADKQKIEETIVNDVLHARRFPEILFLSSSVTKQGETVQVIGELTLVGRTRSLTMIAVAEGDRYHLEVVLHQPDFGLKPYSAMLGALKIKPDVTVRLSLPHG